MRVIPQSERLNPPFICFICESSPPRDAIDVVDSGYDFNPAFLTSISGEKYLCARCVEAAAKVLGFVQTDELDTAKKALEDLRAELLGTFDMIANLASSITDRVRSVGPLPSISDIAGITKSPVVEDNQKERDSGGA
jgi:hypothetical protein